MKKKIEKGPQIHQKSTKNKNPRNRTKNLFSNPPKMVCRARIFGIYLVSATHIESLECIFRRSFSRIHLHFVNVRMQTRSEPNRTGKKTIPKHKTFKGIIKNQASTRHLAKRSRGCNNNRREHTYYNNDRRKKIITSNNNKYYLNDGIFFSIGKPNYFGG